MALIIFCCISPSAWCNHCSIASSWILSTTNCRDHHQHFDSFQDFNGILDDKCHPRSLVIWVTINIILTFLSSQTCSCYGCNLLSSLYYDLPCSITAVLSRMLWGLPHLLRILDISDTSPSPFFLGPRVVPNRNTDRWTSNFKTASNLIALKLMVNISILDHWLSNRHSNIVCAT